MGLLLVPFTSVGNTKLFINPFKVVYVEAPNGSGTNIYVEGADSWVQVKEEPHVVLERLRGFVEVPAPENKS